MSIAARARRLDPERGVDAIRWTEIVTTAPPPAPVRPAPVTMRERLDAYRRHAACDPLYRLRHEDELVGIVGEMIERVEQLEQRQV